MKFKPLRMTRYLQLPGECAVASVASVAHFYNKKIDYDLACKLANTDGQGMYTPDIAMLLNRLGFKKVTVISADIKQLDFKWAKLSKSKLIEEVKNAKRYHPDEGYRESFRSYYQFLTNEECDNNLLIEHHFGQHIREQLSQGKPILASFNWNLFFNYPKWNDDGKPDALRGDYEEHQIVIYGCDDKGVNILDSHHEMYTGKLAKFKKGRYKIDWETLHTVMGFGDLILAEEYDASCVDYELV